MPPSRHSRPPSTTGFPGEPARARNYSVYNVWYYMTHATSSTRPSNGLLENTLIADEERQANYSIIFPHDRPLSARIRCIICLKTRNEWKTWRNRPGPILNKLREHLETEHAITFDNNGMSKRPAEPPSPGSSSELSIPLQETREHSNPKGVYLPLAQTQPAAVAPHETSVTTSNVSQQTSSHPQQPPAPDSLAITLAKTAVRVASNSQPLVPGFRTIENARVQLDQVKAERDQLKVERDQLKVERDHEMDLRRKLQAEIDQLRAASRDREEELLNVSRLMCASIQALARNSIVPGAPANLSSSNPV